MSRNEFAELLWEKGQVMLHGREKSFPSAFPPFSCGGGAGGGSSRAQEKLADGGRSAALPKMGAFGSMAMYPSVNDFPADEDPPPAALDAGRGGDDEEDAVPWIHYPIIDDDDDYCSDLLPELPSAAVTSVSTLLPSQQHNATNRSGEIATGGRERSKECHGLPVPAARPEPPESITKQPRPGGSGEGVMNFSLFSRPAAQARARLQSTQRLQSNGRASNATTSKLTITERTSGARNIPMLTDHRMPWLQGKGTQFISATSLQAAVPNLQQETARDRVDNSMGGATTAGVPQSSQFQDNVAACKNEGRKAPDVAVATSSVCSGNGAGSDDRWRQLKRRDQAECSASQDEDLEDEFGILRRSATRSTKRSRTAEIHNLSERKRRDRINEKMRALQELIPNCNKIDKASMLDEAIEYLKTLQLQVQMMFMGSGLCIPPMLMPQAMQHLQIPPMAHFPHLGMGLGYGTGAFNMSNTPTVPLPPMQGAQFPCPIISGAPQGLGMPGANAVPMFGVSGQGIPSSASGVSPFTSLSGLPVRPNLAPQVSGPMANMVQEQLPSFQNQQQQSLNIEGRQEANTCDPQTKIIPQGDKQHFKLPSLAQTNIQFLHASDNMTNSTGKDGAGPSTTAGNCTN